MNDKAPYRSLLLAALTLAVHAGALVAFVSGYSTPPLAVMWLVMATLAPHLVARFYGPRLAYGLASIPTIMIPLALVIAFRFPLDAAISIAIPLGLLIAIWQFGIVYATQLVRHYVHQRWV